MTSKKAATKKKANNETQKDGILVERSDPESHAEPSNKIHEAGVTNPITTSADKEKESNVDDPSLRIAPNKVPKNGTEAHELATSRGLEVGFHQMPQGGLMNLDNLKG